MNSCNHENIEYTKIKRSFLSHEFTTQGSICKDCGAELWSNAVHSAFHNWLNNLEIDNQKQYNISENTQALLKKLNEQFYCNDESKLVRSIITVLSKKLSNAKYNTIFNNLMESNDFQSLIDETHNIHKKVRITNPKSLYDYENWKEILNFNDSEFIRTLIVLILVINKQVNNEFSSFWENEIKEALEMVLAA